MSELTVNQLIKLVIGAFVIVAVISGLYLIFKNNILEFFANLPDGSFWRALF